MHVIVIGCGRVGSGLAVALTKAGHTVAIIDKTPKSFRRLPADWPGQQILGSGFDRDLLEEAGIRRADSLAAVTSGDNTNILCARIARETYEISRVVARIYDPRRAEIFQRLGIPTIPTVAFTIEHVMRRIIPERAITEWSSSTGHLHLIEQPLPAEWEGHKLPREVLTGNQIRVVAVTRAGAPAIDTEDFIGQEGDVLHLIVTGDAGREMQAVFPGVSIVPRARREGDPE